MTEVLDANPQSIEIAARILTAGGLVAFPTETVYGLGAHALRSEATEKIFKAKGRPAANPLIVHAAEFAQLDLLALWNTRQQQQAQMLADAFWPGPLTIVVPKRPIVPDIVTASGPTVALRIPAHPVALALLRACGFPLAAPSANRSEEISPTRAEHVWDSLRGRIDLILDGGACVVGVESTVIDISGDIPRLLRPGAISQAELESVLHTNIISGNQAGAPLRSPGQSKRHYAPKSPLRLSQSPWSEALAFPHSAVLAYGAPPMILPPNLRMAIILPDDPVRYAAKLYESLHRLDRLHPSNIITQSVPDSSEWLAVQDRLSRAAAHW